MGKLAHILTIILALAGTADASWWLENDYSAGASGFSRETLSVFVNVSTKVAAGLSGSWLKDNDIYNDGVFSARTALMFTGRGHLISLRPFVYPASSKINSSAYGAKASSLFTLAGDSEDTYLHLTVSAAAARQKTVLSGGTDKTSFSESAFELQMEKSFYNQFFFMLSGSAFTPPDKASNATLSNPALDHSEMAYLGTFRDCSALVDWTMGVQFARNMAPDFDSYIYAGFSRISLRASDPANSYIGGLRVKISEKSSMDIAYNNYRMSGSGPKDYYKLLLQIFF